MPAAGLYPGSGVPPMLTLLVSNTACGGRASVRFRTAAMLPVLLTRMVKDRELPTEACAVLALLTRLITGMYTEVLTVFDRAVPLNAPAVKEALALLVKTAGLGKSAAFT
ncbi:hypothetical protein D3C86_1793180 [compost metagenome]